MTLIKSQKETKIYEGKKLLFCCDSQNWYETTKLKFIVVHKLIYIIRASVCNSLTASDSL